jgi:hypothetical protein
LYFALPPWIGVTCLIVLAVAAFLRGGVEERIVAAGLVANVMATVALRDWSLPHLQVGEFILDVAMFVLVLTVALRSDKYWPMPAAAFELLDTLMHVAKLVDPNVHQWAYFTAIVIWTYALMAALGVGVWNSWRAGRYLANAEAPFAAAARR